jgi:hypothetical protein
VTTRSTDAVVDGLIAKGMVKDENHHHMLRKKLDGVTTLVTRVSHGAREIDEHNGKLMANQCALQLREFWDLVDCPLSEADWDAKVAERCSGGRNPFLGR